MGKLVAGQLANKGRDVEGFASGGKSTYYIRVRNDPQCFLIENVTLLLFYGHDPIFLSNHGRPTSSLAFPQF